MWYTYCVLYLILIGYIIGYLSCLIAVLKAEVHDNKRLSLGMLLIISYVCLFWVFLFPMIVILYIDENISYDILSTKECSKTWKGALQRWLMK
jgi:hypothetical protein